MSCRLTPAIGLLTLLASAASAQSDPEKVHIRMHKRVAPSVVAVSGGGQQGSGVCIGKEGIILTSPTACGTESERVSVIAPGAREYSARVIGRNNDKELVVLKIDASLPAIDLADSAQAKVGQIVYVLGDSFDSIRNDDQVALSVGVVSSIYELPKRQRQTYYTGPVLETSAAVNQNQDGGPMVDGEGRLLGLVTLNYEESKFTGVAIPINELKGEIEAIVEEFRSPGASVRVDRRRTGWLGATVEELPGSGLSVTKTAFKSPAVEAGLKEGDVITHVNSQRVLTEERFKELMSRLDVGAAVKLVVKRNGKELTLNATLGKRNEY